MTATAAEPRALALLPADLHILGPVPAGRARPAEDAPAATPAPRGLLPRREAFCRHVAAGRPLAAAARLAGYAWVGAKQQGWRLIRDPAVAARIAELSARNEARRRAELDLLVEGARQVFDGARSDRNHFAALKALEMISRLRGTLGAPAALAVLGADDDQEEEAALEEMEDSGTLPEAQPDEPAALMPAELPAPLDPLVSPPAPPDPLALALDAQTFERRRAEAAAIARRSPAAAAALAEMRRSVAPLLAGAGAAGPGASRADILAALSGPGRGSLLETLLLRASWGQGEEGQGEVGQAHEDVGEEAENDDLR
jgi:hypothetical protein